MKAKIITLALVTASLPVAYFFGPDLLDTLTGKSTGVPRGVDPAIKLYDQTSSAPTTPSSEENQTKPVNDAEAKPVIPKSSKIPARALNHKKGDTAKKAKASKKHGGLKKQKRHASNSGSNDAWKHVLVKSKNADQSATEDYVNARDFSQENAAIQTGKIKEREWVSSLSGKDVNFRISDKMRGEKCLSGKIKCADVKEVKDVSLVGVVVDTQKIQHSTSEPLLDGEMRRGNFAEHTPAVYVK